MAVKIISINIPEYTIKSKPLYLSIGKKVDKEIEENFGDGVYLVRAIRKDDHPKLSLDQLISLILKTGTDRYD